MTTKTELENEIKKLKKELEQAQTEDQRLCDIITSTITEKNKLQIRNEKLTEALRLQNEIIQTLI